jgi:metal-sulfur cluster biosynthetic enzyme
MNEISSHTVNVANALAGLREVLDPEIGLNVVDMGLVYQLEIDEAVRKIVVIMTLSTQFCPMGHSIIDAVENNLLAHFPGYTVLVKVVFEPVWNQQMISKEGLDFLNR